MATRALVYETELLDALVSVASAEGGGCRRNRGSAVSSRAAIKPWSMIDDEAINAGAEFSVIARG